MAVTKINLHNKILSITSFNNIFYISTFTGHLFTLTKPYTTPNIAFKLSEPISAIIPGSVIYTGTWNGNIYANTTKIHSFGCSIIKAMCSYKNKIYISSDTRLYVTTSRCEIEKVIEIGYKILCMGVVSDILYFGCGVPMLIKFNEELEFIGSNGHETSILSLSSKNGKVVTASADGTLRCEGKVIYKGHGWVRCVKDDVFVVDKCLFKNYTIICEHEDYISGVEICNNYIVCVGLDGFISVLGDVECSLEEENDIEAFLLECD